MVAVGFCRFFESEEFWTQYHDWHNIRGHYHNVQEKLYTAMWTIFCVDSFHIGECLDESGRSPSSAGNILGENRQKRAPRPPLIPDPPCRREARSVDKKESKPAFEWVVSTTDPNDCSLTLCNSPPASQRMRCECIESKPSWSIYCMCLWSIYI